MDENKNILFCEPIEKKLVWGSELWGVSASADNDCMTNTGKTLGSIYKDFPLLIKTIESNEDLSIQVHPDDYYANANEDGSLGKKECWFILDCKDNAEIIAGQKTKSREEFMHYFNRDEMDKILCRRPLKKGDFILLNPGCVHAILGGTKLLEVQQASDITYRIYDYGRGRELHLDKALDVIDFKGEPPQILNFADTNENITNLSTNNRFKVDLVNIENQLNYPIKTDFICVYVIEGTGSVNNKKLSEKDYLVIDKNAKIAEFEGKMELIIASPPIK